MTDSSEKRRAIIRRLLLFLILIVPPLFFFGYLLSWPEPPTSAYERHFGPKPSSVSNLTHSGRISLTGGSERLIFWISPKDFSKFPEHFIALPDGYKTLEKMVPQFSEAQWESEMAEARAAGVDPAEVYIRNTMDHGLTYQILVTNSHFSRVYYHYTRF